MTDHNLLEIRDLTVLYHTEEDDVHALTNVSLTLKKGETLGLVGETGAGKTTTALSVMRLLPRRVGEIRSGEILFEGRDLLKATDADMRAIRGASISMIFQDPMTSLNPTIKVGDQIAESIHLHHPDMKKPEVEKRVDEILEMVGIPAVRKSEYPHQFSGGMKQRVVIAIALALEPQLLIADEPTTALDVTIQAQILDLMNELRESYDTSVIMITHDLGVIAETCENVAVLYAGQVVEQASVTEIFHEAAHPYTMGLLKSVTSLGGAKKELYTISGTVPTAGNFPSGCRFADRCPHASQKCREQNPDLVEIAPGHLCRCHLHANSAGKEASV